MSRTPTGRPRGAQPGNQNRLKHGLYSKIFSMGDRNLLESLPSELTRHELALARIRLKTCLNKQLSASPEDWLTYERAIARYLGLIVSSIHKNASHKDYGPSNDLDVLRMIRMLNGDQND